MSRKPSPERRIFCNRTLNLRGIKAIGYDMDYTLVHYNVETWERVAYEHAKQRLESLGWPVARLKFDHDLMVRGLIIDVRHGNVLKANRFGYVKRAFHGTRPMAFDDQRRAYSRTVVDLSQSRFVFLNTLFSLSEACLYSQMVDLLDRGKLPEGVGYTELYEVVRQALDESHLEGELKQEIAADPDSFVQLDRDTPLTLLDQKMAGKKVLLITNSDWSYTRAMMTYAFDRFLKGSSWRDLFDLVIVNARKPKFFSETNPAFVLASDEGLLQPTRSLELGGAYHGADAAKVETALQLSGDQILYVGDHIWGDVAVSKSILRWRTALVLRELEEEVRAEQAFAPAQKELERLMDRKVRLEHRFYSARLDLQRLRKKYGPKPRTDRAKLESRVESLRREIEELDAQISPAAQQAAELSNPKWGLLMRAGNDKSHLARQVERSADIYMSRVSNLMYATPFAYLRSSRGSLPHDRTL